MYKLQFENDDRGRQRYEVCHQAIVLTQEAPKVADWDDVVSLLKKIKEAGSPGKDRIGKTVLYELKDEGSEVILENSEMKLLQAFISSPIWRPEVLDDVQETKRWLEKLPRVPGSLARDARPQERRAGLALTGDLGEKGGDSSLSTTRNPA